MKLNQTYARTARTSGMATVRRLCADVQTMHNSFPFEYLVPAAVQDKCLTSVLLPRVSTRVLPPLVP
jgi:hypothetical protein